METLLIKVNEREKADLLMELLKSMDFITSVNYVDDFKSTRELFIKVNEIAATTNLKNLTEEDINFELNQYRLGKKTAN